MQAFTGDLWKSFFLFADEPAPGMKWKVIVLRLWDIDDIEHGANFHFTCVWHRQRLILYTQKSNSPAWGRECRVLSWIPLECRAIRPRKVLDEHFGHFKFWVPFICCVHPIHGFHFRIRTFIEINGVCANVWTLTTMINCINGRCLFCDFNDRHYNVGNSFGILAKCELRIANYPGFCWILCNMENGLCGLVSSF